MLSANTLIVVFALLLAVLPLLAFPIPSFSFKHKTGVSNRILTPNGDRKNDNVVFTFENPRDSAVAGRIYDIRGAFVENMRTRPPLKARFQLFWDGKSNGAPVPTGLYIYQLSAEGRVYTGTVVVIR